MPDEKAVAFITQLDAAQHATEAARKQLKKWVFDLKPELQETPYALMLNKHADELHAIVGRLLNIGLDLNGSMRDDDLQS